MALSKFRSKFNNSSPESRFSMVKLKLYGSRFSRKSCICGGKIEIKGDGRACCNLCNVVFNDGGNTDGLVKVTHFNSDGTKEEIIPRAPPPKNHSKDSMRGMHKFLKACRA